MRKIIISLLLIIFFSAHPENKFNALPAHRIQNSNFSVKKVIELHAKPAIAATSMGAGAHLLYDAIKTTLDMQSSPQRNTQKGITLNALLGATLVAAGIWFFNHIWDEEPEEKTHQNSSNN
jgi:hypothetical protein